MTLRIFRFTIDCIATISIYLKNDLPELSFRERETSIFPFAIEILTFISKTDMDFFALFSRAVSPEEKWFDSGPIKYIPTVHD